MTITEPPRGPRELGARFRAMELQQSFGQPESTPVPYAAASPAIAAHAARQNTCHLPAARSLSHVSHSIPAHLATATSGTPNANPMAAAPAPPEVQYLDVLFAAQQLGISIAETPDNPAKIFVSASSNPGVLVNDEVVKVNSLSPEAIVGRGADDDGEFTEDEWTSFQTYIGAAPRPVTIRFGRGPPVTPESPSASAAAPPPRPCWPRPAGKRTACRCNWR